jgi:hypothetical protein
MEVGELVARGFSNADATCPMEPHDDEGKVEGKAINVKEVAELHRNMASGKSTCQWVQKDLKFSQGTNTVEPQRLPDVDDEPVHIDGHSYPISVAAHHILPGKECLPKGSIAQYIWASKGLIRSDDVIVHESQSRRQSRKIHHHVR